MDRLTALGAALAAAHFGMPLAYYAAARRRLKMPWRTKPDPAYAPAVTVTIPTYNEARHIEEKLEDIHRQDYPRDRFEIIVVDSASTDGTAERARGRAAVHPDADVKVVEEPQRRGKASYATAGGEGLDPPIPPCWEEPMPYAVYEALVMGVPVVALPIGGQADLISQTPSAQFKAEDTSAKAYIKAVIRAAAVPRQEMEKLRKITAETATMILDRQSLYTIIINTSKSHDDADGNHATWHETGR